MKRRRRLTSKQVSQVIHGNVLYARVTMILAAKPALRVKLSQSRNDQRNLSEAKNMSRKYFGSALLVRLTMILTLISVLNVKHPETRNGKHQKSALLSRTFL
jgi:hypothetical protein